MSILITYLEETVDGYDRESIIITDMNELLEGESPEERGRIVWRYEEDEFTQYRGIKNAVELYTTIFHEVYRIMPHDPYVNIAELLDNKLLKYDADCEYMMAEIATLVLRVVGGIDVQFQYLTTD